MTSTGVSNYFPHISLAVALFLSVFFSSNLCARLSVELDPYTGCGRLSVVQSQVVQSSCHFVYNVPRTSTLKLYRWFWWVASFVACRGFESQRYEVAKIQPSEVESVGFSKFSRLSKSVDIFILVKY